MEETMTKVEEAMVLEAAESLGLRVKKLHRRISWEEFNERWFNGLCMFCGEPETLDHHLRHKNSGILMLEGEGDQLPHDEIGLKSEAGQTDSSNHVESIQQLDLSECAEKMETETMDSVLESHCIQHTNLVATESISQSQVHVSKLEHGLQFRNESSTVCEVFQSVVGCDDLFDPQETLIQASYAKAKGMLLQESTSVANTQVAHQLFDTMPLKEQSKKRHIKCPTCWRFKFKQGKQQRDRLGIAHKLKYRGGVKYKYPCSSINVALMKKNKFSKSWSKLHDDCFKEDGQVYHATFPLWPLVRFRFWKFKFRNMKLQKMMREHGYAGNFKLLFDKKEYDDMFMVASTVSVRYMLDTMLGIRESDAGHKQQTVYEHILMVNEQLLQTSLILKQVMRSKKIKFPKRWMFKYKAPNLDTKVFRTSDQCIRKRASVSDDREAKNQPSLRLLMDTKQFRLSLRANRVWDPGGLYLKDSDQ